VSFREPFLALRDEQLRHLAFFTFPAGAILTVRSEQNKQGMVEVAYEGKIYAAFMRDVKERCDQVQAQSE